MLVIGVTNSTLCILGKHTCQLYNSVACFRLQAAGIKTLKHIYEMIGKVTDSILFLLRAYLGRHFYAYSVYCVVDDFEIEYFHQQHKLQATFPTSASQTFNVNMDHLEISLNWSF